VERKSLADWILCTPATACSRIVHDRNSRCLVVIAVSKHSSSKQWDVECAEVGWTYCTWVDLRRGVCFVRRTAFQLDRDVVRPACNARRIHWISRRHGRLYDAGLLTHAFEHPPEIVAELCSDSRGIGEPGPVRLESHHEHVLRIEAGFDTLKPGHALEH